MLTEFKLPLGTAFELLQVEKRLKTSALKTMAKSNLLIVPATTLEFQIEIAKWRATVIYRYCGVRKFVEACKSAQI
jgi:hypothetical protein